MRAPVFIAALLLSGCRGEGKWDLLASGGDPVEAGMTSDEFLDSCAVSFGAVEVSFQSVELVDADGESGGGVEVPSRLDLAADGPHTVGLLDVLAGEYDTLDIQLGTASSDAVRLEGVLTCPVGTAYFDWSFSGPIRTTCEGAAVAVDKNGDEQTLLEVRADNIFSPSASNTDPDREGLHLLGLDDDLDGYVTLEELAMATGDEAGLEPGAVPADMRTHVTERIYGMIWVEDGQNCTSTGPG